MNPFTNVARCIAYIVLIILSGCVADPELGNFDDGENGIALTRAQSDNNKFYYSFDEKICLDEVHDKIVLRYDDNEDIRQYLPKVAAVRNIGINQDERVAVLEIDRNSDRKMLMEEYKARKGVKSVNPVYRLSEGISSEMFFTDEFVVKFKESVSQQQIEEMHKKYLVEVKEDPYQYLFENTRQLLSVPTDVDVLKIANAYQESGLVVYSQPNFLAQIQLYQYLPTDPYFDHQFYLRNIGQGVNGRTSTYGADIGVTDVWNITRGNPNIVVAVIDEGVTSDHPDIPNTRQIRLNGSNFVNIGNDPSPSGDNNHGNACAGIIVASHNNEGIAGIAPNCKLLPIKIPYGNATPSLLSKWAGAIRLAANNADVISCSFGISTDNPNFSAEVVDAITYATSSGRRGTKGCVVVFAASNSADHTSGVNGIISFPSNANIPGVLTVGATDRNDRQAQYSPTSNPNSSYNQIIDVVAPSHKAYSPQISTETFDVWSIDIPGYNGYNPVKSTDVEPMFGGVLPIPGTYLPSSGVNNDAYTGHFGGTSAACPQVAGVAALILSVNPNLTQKQVADIIEKTARKISFYPTTSTRANGDWNSQIGYGVVNAYEALMSALVGDLAITGPDNPAANTTVTYSVPTPPAGVTFNGWTVTGGTYTTTNGMANRTLNIKFTNVSFTDPIQYTVRAYFRLSDGSTHSIRKDVEVPPVQAPAITGPDNVMVNTGVTYSVPTSLPAGITFDGWTVSPDSCTTNDLTSSTLDIIFTDTTQYTLTANFILPNGTPHIIQKVVRAMDGFSNQIIYSNTTIFNGDGIISTDITVMSGATLTLQAPSIVIDSPFVVEAGAGLVLTH